MVNRRLREILRIALVLLSISLGLFMLFSLLSFFVVKKLVPDDDVRSLYSSHKEELERLKSMCSEDGKKSSVKYFGVSAQTREVDCVRRIGSIERCQEYARLFAMTKVRRAGWEEDCVWLLVDGWGPSIGGKRKGLMWRATAMPQQDSRSRQRYVSIEGGWYIYEISVDNPLFVARQSEPQGPFNIVPPQKELQGPLKITP